MEEGLQLDPLNLPLKMQLDTTTNLILKDMLEGVCRSPRHATQLDAAMLRCVLSLDRSANCGGMPTTCECQDIRQGTSPSTAQLRMINTATRALQRQRWQRLYTWPDTHLIPAHTS